MNSSTDQDRLSCRRSGRRRATARLRDGMSIPLALTLRTVAKALLRPQWWIDCLTTEPLAGTVVELVDSMFDPTVTSDDLAWIKSQWPGKVGPGGATATRRYGFGPAPRC